jgi:hypothetical protein
MKPSITIDDPRGRHNLDPGTANRIIKGNTCKDLSTIMVVVTRGLIPCRVVQSWLNLIPPINQRFIRMFVEGMEVGEGYNAAVENILAHPELSKWRYLLTVEEDNTPPPDGLLKLYESINGPYDVVGGLYFTKGEGGVPQCWGHPHSSPRNYAPFMPAPEGVTECNGTGMGFTLFKLDLFKRKDWERPFFKTLQENVPGVGFQCATQDLHFAGRAAKLGIRFAIDSRVKVGHWDQAAQITW